MDYDDTGFQPRSYIQYVYNNGCAVVNVAVDLDQAVLNDLACLRAVLYEVGELEELAEADHVVANKNFFHAL